MKTAKRKATPDRHKKTIVTRGKLSRITTIQCARSRLAWLSTNSWYCLPSQKFPSLRVRSRQSIVQMRLGSEMALLLALVVLTGLLATGLLALVFLK
jgi:hypothetical protein